MNLNNKRMALVGATALAALVALPVVASADQPQRRRTPAAGPRSAGQSAPASRPAPAATAPRVQSRPSAPPRAQTAPQSRPVYRAEPPRTPSAPPRGYTAARGYAGTTRGYAVPRRTVAPRGVFIAPRMVRFSQPYYRFQPQVRLSFGLYVGYPVAYPYSRYDPFAYPRYDSYYGYGMPSRADYGGLSFDIQPYDAALFIDGVYVGTAADFSRYTAPLTLAVGLHHIDLTAEGFQTMSFDITVVGGQVIPYQGTLPPIRR